MVLNQSHKTRVLYFILPGVFAYEGRSEIRELCPLNRPLMRQQDPTLPGDESALHRPSRNRQTSLEHFERRERSRRQVRQATTNSRCLPHAKKP